MKENEKYLTELHEIRKLMESSSRFLTLSGLSGVLVGIIALAAAYLASLLISGNSNREIFSGQAVSQLILLGAVTLLISLATILILTRQRASRAGKKFWNPASRLILVNLSVPLVSGGILILVFIFREYFDLIASACLLFYGLALVNAAKFTHHEIFFLGILQVLLGLAAAIFPALGLLLWALGFGVLHLIYGTLMYFRYERNSNS